MDEIDSFLMNRDDATNEERAMVNAFLRNCDNLEQQGIIILGSTNYGDKCDTAAVGSGRFNNKIQFNIPSEDELASFLNGDEKIQKETAGENEQNIIKIAKFMKEHGMNWADAQNVLNNCLDDKKTIDDKKVINYQKAMLYLIEKCKGKSSVQISSLIQEKPPGMKEALGWDDIYGLDDQKRDLKQWADDVKQGKKDAFSGYLLHGPAGCGKTTLPFALAKRIGGSPVYTLRLGENGVTVNNIKDIIEEIKLEGLRRQINDEPPLILFMDEAEAMIPNRDGADLMHGVTNSHERTTTMLNAIQNLQNSGVLCLAATNHPECIDASAKRNDRLPLMEIGMPIKEGVQEFLEKKYEPLPKIQDKNGNELDAEKLAGIFCESKKSRLSIANIAGIMKEIQQKVEKGESVEEKDVKKMVKEKVKAMTEKPLESGLTQIGRSLNEIKEKLENLSHLEQLGNLDEMQKSLAAMKDAIGDPKDGEEKLTLLRLIEDMAAKLKCIGALDQIETLCNEIKTQTKQNGQVVTSFNTAVEALKTAIIYMQTIADQNRAAFTKYEGLVDGIVNALTDLHYAMKKQIDAINGIGDQIGAQTDVINGITMAISGDNGVIKALNEMRDALLNIQGQKTGTGDASLNGGLEQIEKAINSLKNVLRDQLPNGNLVYMAMKEHFKNEFLLSLNSNKHRVTGKSYLECFFKNYFFSGPLNVDEISDHFYTYNSQATEMAHMIMMRLHPESVPYFYLQEHTDLKVFGENIRNVEKFKKLVLRYSSFFSEEELSKLQQISDINELENFQKKHKDAFKKFLEEQMNKKFNKMCDLQNKLEETKAFKELHAIFQYKKMALNDLIEWLFREYNIFSIDDYKKVAQEIVDKYDYDDDFSDLCSKVKAKVKTKGKAKGKDKDKEDPTIHIGDEDVKLSKILENICIVYDEALKIIIGGIEDSVFPGFNINLNYKNYR